MEHVSTLTYSRDICMGVSGPPKSSIFDRVFHYKPSILGYIPLFFGNTHIDQLGFSQKKFSPI